MVGARQSVAPAAMILGVSSQTLYNWIKVQQAGRCIGVGVRPEQMELVRPRAELAKAKMELAIVRRRLKPKR